MTELAVEWKESVERSHGFTQDELAAAREVGLLSPPEWPEDKSEVRDYAPKAILARWDAFLQEHAEIGTEWKQRNDAMNAFSSIFEDAWERPGQMSREEAGLWLTLAFTPGLFTQDLEAARADVRDSDWITDTPPVPDAAGVEERIKAFADARTTSNEHWSMYSLYWLGWIAGTLLDAGEEVRVLTSNFEYSDALLMLTKLEPKPHDSEETKARVQSLSDHFEIVPGPYRHFGSREQRDLARVLRIIPSEVVARKAYGLAKTSSRYDFGLPLWFFTDLLTWEKDADLAKALNASSLSYCSYSDGEDQAPPKIVALFERFGYEGLKHVVKLAANKSNKGYLDRVLEHLWRIHAPEMVEALQQIDGKAEAADKERVYLLGEGANVVSGLITMAKSRGKKRDFALRYLGEYVDAGHTDLIERLLEDAPKKSVEVVREELFTASEEGDSAEEPRAELTADEMPDWLRAIAALGEDASSPDYALPDRFPEVFLAGSDAPIPSAVLERLVAAIWLKYKGYRPGKFITKEGHGEQGDGAAQRAAIDALDALPAALDRTSAGELWQTLFDQMRREGSVWSTDIEMVMAVAELGSGAQYDFVETQIRNRSGKGFSEHTCNAALDALMLSGDRAAWAAILEASVRVRDKDIRRYARGRLDRIRVAKGWTNGQLHDRLVPDCGLDERGTRVFDYGGRTFELVFQGAFDVGITDADGKHYARLPAARKADDREMVKAAKADFKVVKKQIALVVETQTRRLVEDLVSARTWSGEDFLADVVGHPLLRHFARKLVWGVYDAEGALTETFVPNQDGGCMNVDYDEFDLAPDATVRLLHPIEVGPDVVHEWSNVLADFEYIQPFEQFERTVYRREQWDDAFARVASIAGHWKMIESLKETRRWEGLIKTRKSTKRKCAFREVRGSNLFAYIAYHKGAWSLSGDTERPADGLYFGTLSSGPNTRRSYYPSLQSANIKPEYVLERDALPERVVSDILDEILSAYDTH